MISFVWLSPPTLDTHVCPSVMCHSQQCTDGNSGHFEHPVVNCIVAIFRITQWHRDKQIKCICDSRETVCNKKKL
jgi:hypothetical protein